MVFLVICLRSSCSGVSKLETVCSDRNWGWAFFPEFGEFVNRMAFDGNWEGIAVASSVFVVVVVKSKTKSPMLLNFSSNLNYCAIGIEIPETNWSS